eukprot:3067056-Amphidinium_carterae.1
MGLLPDWGLIEASPPHSAVRHKGGKARSGLFGVHKRWRKDDHGKFWQRIRIAANIWRMHSLV